MGAFAKKGKMCCTRPACLEVAEKQCSRCKVPYCSRACQRLDFSAHKPTCFRTHPNPNGLLLCAACRVPTTRWCCDGCKMPACSDDCLEMCGGGKVKNLCGARRKRTGWPRCTNYNDYQAEDAARIKMHKEEPFKALETVLGGKKSLVALVLGYCVDFHVYDRRGWDRPHLDMNWRGTLTMGSSHYKNTSVLLTRQGGVQIGSAEDNYSPEYAATYTLPPPIRVVHDAADIHIDNYVAFQDDVFGMNSPLCGILAGLDDWVDVDFHKFTTDPWSHANLIYMDFGRPDSYALNEFRDEAQEEEEEEEEAIKMVAPLPTSKLLANKSNSRAIVYVRDVEAANAELRWVFAIGSYSGVMFGF